MLHSLSRKRPSFLGVVLLLGLSTALRAQTPATEPAPLHLTTPASSGYLARIGYDDPEQLAEALDRVQEFFEENGSQAQFSPVSIVVHGPEVEVFERSNYDLFKPIVDKAAQLSALGLLDIAVCETRMHYEGIDVQEVYPFVEKVPFGPAEIDRLLNIEEYIYF